MASSRAFQTDAFQGNAFQAADIGDTVSTFVAFVAARPPTGKAVSRPPTGKAASRPPRTSTAPTAAPRVIAE